MNEFIETLYQEFEEEMEVYNELGGLPVKRLAGALFATSEALKKLEAYVLEQPFESQADEIRFFKYQKPKFLFGRLLALDTFKIETSRPINDAKLLRAFYLDELASVQRYFEKHKFWYNYYRFDMREIDQLLFVRGAAAPIIALPDFPAADPSFTTKGEQLFARFKANEKLREYLISELDSLDQSSAKLVEALSSDAIKMPLTKEII